MKLIICMNGSNLSVEVSEAVYLALDELLPTAKRYSEGHETVYGLVSGMAAWRHWRAVW